MKNMILAIDGGMPDRSTFFASWPFDGNFE
jgi:hypothetical protein